MLFRFVVICDGCFSELAGRKANTKYLGLENVGVQLDKSGAVKVSLGIRVCGNGRWWYEYFEENLRL